LATRVTEDQLARLETYLEGPWIAVLATKGTDGFPLLAPVWYNYAGGRLTISSRRDTAKFRNLSRDSRVALSICSEPQAKEYVTIWGRAETTYGDSIWPATRAILGRYQEPEDADKYLVQMQAQDRAIISVQPERVRFRN